MLMKSKAVARPDRADHPSPFHARFFLFHKKVLCVPFAWYNPVVDKEALAVPGSWEGVVEPYNIGVYIENYLLLVIGGIPWQVVHALRWESRDMMMSFFTISSSHVMFRFTSSG